MSSGSYLSENFVPWTDPGNSWYGSKVSKSWSGVDSPKPTRSPRIPITLKRYSRKRGAYEVTVYVRDPNASGGANGKDRGEHPYSKQVKSYRSDLITFRPTGWTSDRTVASFGYCVFGSFTNFSALENEANLGAQSELRSALQGGSDFNLGASLGELGETVGMVGDAVRTISSSLFHLRKGRWSKAVGILFRHLGHPPRKEHLLPRNPQWVVQNASACWLELQYGWLPLLSDVKAAAEAFADHLSFPTRTQIRFGREASETIKNSQNFGNLGSLSSVAVKTSKVHYKVILEAPPSVASKLGVLDPLSIAWELVPLSFVVDWFIPIGDYLTALGGSNGLKVKSVTKSVKNLSVFTIPVSGANTFMSFSRTVLPSWPNPPLPRFKPLFENVNVQHAISGIALAVQKFKH